MASRNRSRSRSVRLPDSGPRTPEPEFADQPTGRGLTRLLGRRAEPDGGNRVALSYLVGVLAALLGGGVGWAIAAELYRREVVCRGDEGLVCPFVSFLGIALIGTGALMALGAWWARLGWLWWLVGAALCAFIVEVVGDPSSLWLLTLVFVPAVAAVVTDPGQHGRSRRRTWITAVVAGGMLLQFVVASWLAVQ